MSGLPRLYTPEEIAEPIGRRPWWVKEQCRRGRFPFIKAGGAYRFTSEHFAEILRLLEHRPGQPQQRTTAAGRRAKPQTSPEPVVQLRARQPRRARGA